MTPRLAYGIFMLLALAVFLVARHFTPKPPALEALPPWKRWLLALAGFIGGVFGAKMPFVVLYGDSWLQWFTTWLSDGKTIVVGMIGAYVSVEVMKLFLGVTVKTGDTFAVPLALAMAVGRLGCFFNGCCYGTPTSLPWGVPFTVGDQVRICHPTQIYESAFHLIMAGILLLLMRTGLLLNQRLKLYLIVYGVYRFLTEFIRPEPAWWMGLTFYQWAALVLAVGLTIQWLAEAVAQRNCAIVLAEPQAVHTR